MHVWVCWSTGRWAMRPLLDNFTTVSVWCPLSRGGMSMGNGPWSGPRSLAEGCRGRDTRANA